MLHVKYHHLKLWKAHIYFCITDDYEALNKRFTLTIPKDFKFKDVDAFVWTEWHKDGGCYYYLVTRPDRKPSVLIHECVHLANNILTDRGIESPASNDEALAYLVEYLFDEITNVESKFKTSKQSA